MPKTVEISEEDFLRDQNLRSLVQRIMADPKARVLVEQAHKIVEPNAKTPTLDAQKTASEPIESLRKEMSDFIAAQNKANEERTANEKRAELQAKIDAGFAHLRQREGYNEDGIKKVEEIMQAKGILDPLDAATIFEKQNPPPAPSTPVGGAWNFPDIPKDGGDAYEKSLLDSKGQNDLIAEREALRILQEIRGTRRN